MEQNKVIVFHDRNTGILGPLMRMGIKPHHLFLSESFTEKLIDLNYPEFTSYSRVPDNLEECNSILEGVQFLFTAPFCAPFSNLNRTSVEPGKDDPLLHPKVKDAVNMVDLAVKYKPKVFTMESVARAADFMHEHFVPRLMKAGYNVLLWEFDSYLLGLPQSRPRMLLMAMQDRKWQESLLTFGYNPPIYDSDIDPRRVWAQLETTSQSDIAETLPYERDLWELTPRGHKLRTTFKKAVGDMDSPGPGLGLVRLHPKGLSVVISQSSDLFHPGIPRRLTVSEALNLMSFPSNTKIPGIPKNVYRLGNGMPYIVGLKMLRIIAKHRIRDENEGGTQYKRVDWKINRQQFLFKDRWSDELWNSRPEWFGKFYKARGREFDRSQRR